MNKEPGGEIVIYEAPDGTITTEVHLFGETLWLNLNQIAGLFGRDKGVISRHIKNIFESGELLETATVANFATVQKEGKRSIARDIQYYNLDMIISVGYRVNSKRGTQFRIWANRILKEHLLRGFTLNEKRLKERDEELRALKSGIALLERSVVSRAHNLDEAKGLVAVIADFSRGLKILDDYDRQKLDERGITKREAVFIRHGEFLERVAEMKTRFDSEIFGREKDDSFRSSVAQIYQSFGGDELYPTIEEKAAILLYLVVKNHSFVDGNKRIAAALFLYFLDRNGLLYPPDGGAIISNEGLAALTLMIAESRPDEMETVIKVIVSILNRGRQTIM